MNTEVLRSAWKRQGQWSHTANELKAGFDRWRRVVFGLTIIAAISASLSVELQSGLIASASAILAAICASLSPVISAWKVNKEQLHAWTRARSVSEELKSSIFRYLISKAGDRAQLLNDAQEAAIESVRDIVPASEPIDISRRALLEDMTVEDYIQNRLLDQAEQYYFPQAKKNDRVAKNFHQTYFILMLIAAVIAAASGLSGLQWLGNWTAVLTTLGASILAYLAAGRYEYLSISYQATGNQLINLRNRWEEPFEKGEKNDVNFYRFVDECEAVISNQNQAWHAKIAAEENQLS